MAEPLSNSPLTLLVVDDTPDNLSLMAGLLKDHYRTRLAVNGALALQLAPSCDLILLDVMMPEMDGYSVCRQLKANPDTADIPVIFLTARSQDEDEEYGLSLGAVDYLTKPISPPILYARVATHLRLRQASRWLKGENQLLEHLVQQRTAELSRLQDALITAMASMAETRDNETGNHIRRTQHYVAALARTLRQHPRFADTLTEENITLLYKSAPLHDIGKVGVPDRILLKPGRLDAEEFEEMKKHTLYGRDTILSVERELGGSNSFLTFAREIAHYHQEKWDGSGYPEGLAGDAIPLSARLMAVADVYDALISRRVYKPPFPHEEAVRILREGRARHFDPDILDAFLQIEAEFREIAERYRDEE
ncbi:HD-GYP domain-containing protein [Leeia sp.]|uniref:HD-GYP domain-containing protein n=1 Tax=Leeia sp. TaxID=2884678 RepID=UPI0035B062F0